MEKLNKDNYFKCECGMFKMKHTSCLNPTNRTCDKEKPFVITEHEYNNISQPASPPSMPDEAFALKLNKFIHEQCIDGVPHDIGWNAMLMMRSQCEGLIKQKAVEFADFILNGGWYEADSKPYHWCRMEEFIMVYKTTEEMYEIFNQQER